MEENGRFILANIHRGQGKSRVLFAVSLIMVPDHLESIGANSLQLGCCSNVIFLELIIKKDPAAGNLITVAQFAVIALEGLISHLEGLTLKKRKIPIKWYLYQVAVYWIVSVVNNKAFAFQIAMPLHMIFRSASLIASLLLSVLFLRTRYLPSEYLSVIMVTAGITAATFASAKSKPQVQASEFNIVTWSIGIAMLLAALILSALLGIIQELTYKRFGKHTDENMFYSHLLSLPCFVFLYDDILLHVRRFNKVSDPYDYIVSIPYAGVTLPSMWLFLLGNVITQYTCSKGVFTLMSSTNALTVTLAITLRKFVSLLISIFYFQNDFTLGHWIGTLLVFAGTYFYSLKPPLYCRLVNEASWRVWRALVPASKLKSKETM